LEFIQGDALNNQPQRLADVKVLRWKIRKTYRQLNSEERTTMMLMRDMTSGHLLKFNFNIKKLSYSEIMQKPKITNR
jgi:hypothetical protein